MFYISQGTTHRSGHSDLGPPLSSHRTESMMSSVRSEYQVSATGSGAMYHEVSCIKERVISLEEQLQLSRRDRMEAEQRAFRLNEQLDRLWEELADERRERQVEANEVRMQRISDRAELRHSMGSDKEYDDGDEGHLETFVEDNEEQFEQNPELTALQMAEGKSDAHSASDGAVASTACVSEASLSAARHAEAQLKRASADARRAEAMVRREVARAVAKARNLLEYGSQSHGAIQASSRPREEDSERSKAEDSQGEAAATASVQCLGLRLETLDMHLRARLEATEDRVASRCESLQSMIDKLQSMPIEVDNVVRQSVDGLRCEFEEQMSIERRRSADRSQALMRTLVDELEKSIVSQAVAEVRSEVSAAASTEASLIREELLRSRAEEASRQNTRMQAAEERLHGLEQGTYRTEMGSEALGSGVPGQCQDPAPAVALHLIGESVTQLESSIGGLMRRYDELRGHVENESSKTRREVDDVRSRVSRLTASDLSDIQQRLELFEDRVCKMEIPRLGENNQVEPHMVPRRTGLSEVAIGPDDRLALARLTRVEEALELQCHTVMSTSRSCDVLERLGRQDPDLLRSLSMLPVASSREAFSGAKLRSSSEDPRLAATQLNPSLLFGFSGHASPELWSRLASGPATSGAPVASPGVSIVLSPAGAEAASWDGVRPTSQASHIQRSWSHPVIRGPQDVSVSSAGLLSATVKVMPPNNLAAFHGSTSSGGGIHISTTPLQCGTPHGSLTAPSASSGSLQMGPRSNSPGVAPKRAMPAASTYRAQKPMDSPFLRFRPIQLQASTAPGLPARPMSRGRP